MTKKKYYITIIFAFFIFSSVVILCMFCRKGITKDFKKQNNLKSKSIKFQLNGSGGNITMTGLKQTIKLLPPVVSGKISVEEALAGRRSVREYSQGKLKFQQLGQLLWSAQGCTGAGCLRTAPSAGATYPLTVFAVVGDNCVEGIQAGVYKYNPEEHEIVLVENGDKRKELSDAALGQEWVQYASISIVISADYSRTTNRYGERGIRYVHIEVGHSAENILLQAYTLGLSAVPVGAFRDEKVQKVLSMDRHLQPLYIIPVGL